MNISINLVLTSITGVSDFLVQVYHKVIRCKYNVKTK
jgi:hypothetical protein